MKEYEPGDNILDDWTLAKTLGKGSYGSVYQIERSIPGKKDKEKAALKVMSIPHNPEDIEDLENQGYDKETIATYFRNQLDSIIREYAIMLDLKGHTNIIYCDDVKWTPHEDGIGWNIYIKMELLRPLRDVLGTQYREETVVRLAMDICKALSRCKENGIIHRDVKPQNILVSESGDYKLGDFGVAKVSEKTTAGTITGTYEYMAPEVFRGLKYNATADIYSLGIVMYWLMNNKRTPFMPQPPQIPSTSQIEVARTKRFSGEHIPAPVHGGAALKEIVLKACAYDPSDRYQSADDMLAALQALNPQNDGTFTSSGEKADSGETLTRETTVRSEDQATVLTQYIQETVIEKKQKSKRKPVWLMGLVAILAIVLCVGLMALRKPNMEEQLQTVIETTAETLQTEAVESETTASVSTLPVETVPITEPEDNRWVSNVLKADTIGSEITPVYNSRIKKKQIVSVTFVDSLDSAPMSSWDVSEGKDGSVMAWVNGNGQEYDLFIGAEGGINGISSGKNLFKHYSNLKKVSFNENFHLEETESIRGMFSQCKSLTTVDLNNLKTTSVRDMGEMFQECESLTLLDLSNWDVANVQKMDAMFKGCKALTDVDFGEWNSASVETLSSMFLGCEALTSIDLSAFETEAVKDMSSMFESCAALSDVNLSSFNTVNTTSMRRMFVECPKINDMDLSNFDFTNVSKHDYFMDNEKTVNGEPWKNLF